ncbi:Predicted arabinose efflux permease, MFS family [Salinibacillus kushneri]|uniref:Predicted arabinose efflux permease, MFS family n=1 Tax=Salinibacillus kushneri TaxID=237682 RepID=A0A1I0GPK5_9BACI|nr:MFS transporter [Salinibacillus kushneri]SET72993.1 Predicted arabinose efflux permease, MFS family [Salinibacillus kushneri]
MVSKRGRFYVLVALVGISGFSQGMLLPLIAIILEQSGISSSINGLHATGLYIGVLIASPFMEKPLRKIGYKPMILIGGALVFTSLFFFTLWEALWFWFILRLMIGIGDQMLNFSTQTWITSTSDPANRGRDIATYGLSFGAGFTLGPLMTQLISIHVTLPFIISSILCILVWSMMFMVRNELPTIENEDVDFRSNRSSFKRFYQAAKIAWVAFLPPFTYGLLEASLHGNFPVYGMRIGHDIDMLSYILPCFAGGSIITQLPLGALSDKIGRKKVLLSVIGGGIIIFFMASIFEQSTIGLFISFILAGMCVGSIFSLGVSYMTDLLPKNLLPAGNILCGIFFSLGSIIGPFAGGLFIEYFPDLSFFHMITLSLILIWLVIFNKKTNAYSKTSSQMM